MPEVAADEDVAVLVDPVGEVVNRQRSLLVACFCGTPETQCDDGQCLYEPGKLLRAALAGRSVERGVRDPTGARVFPRR